MPAAAAPGHAWVEWLRIAGFDEAGPRYYGTAHGLGVGQAEYCDVPLPVCSDDMLLVADNGITGLRIQSVTTCGRPL